MEKNKKLAVLKEKLVADSITPLQFVQRASQACHKELDHSEGSYDYQSEGEEEEEEEEDEE